MEDPIYEEFWQRDVEESISLSDLKLQKKERSTDVLSWLKSIFTEVQEEYTGFLGPIHIWQVSASMF